MVIWKSPALMILGINFGAFLALGFLFVTMLGVLEPGDTAGGVFTCAMGLGIAASDILWRRSNELPLGSLEASTLFFVIPTWVAGVACFVYGLTLFA